MKTYSFNVDVSWLMHTTCEVEAESEEEARDLVMADGSAVLWEGSLEWGEQLQIIQAVLMSEEEA